MGNTMIYQLIFSTFFVVFQSVSAIAEIPKLSFSLLEQSTLTHPFNDYHDQEVEVRGFFYEGKDGRHVLASQPNLKSCCVGSVNKILNQIVLLGVVPEIPQQRVVSMMGVFVTDPTFNGDDELIGLYYLKNIKVLSDFDDTTIYSLFAFIIVMLFIVIGMIIYRRSKS
jgi:hypothetical protein